MFSYRTDVNNAVPTGLKTSGSLRVTETKDVANRFALDGVA